MILMPCLFPNFINTGLNSSNCTISGLEEFWRYKVYVFGETVAGPSGKVFSEDIFTTKEDGKYIYIMIIY